jgi:hypothetical protein
MLTTHHPIDVAYTPLELQALGRVTPGDVPPGEHTP